MRPALRAFVGLLLPALALGEDFDYADHHTRSIQINTKSDLMQQVYGTVNASNKTLFVRIVGNTSCSLCLLQSPGWNEVVLNFHKNPDVFFADILQATGGPLQTRLTGHLTGGEGGFPTILHFNKATGYSGESYALTRESDEELVATELGPQCEDQPGHKYTCKGLGGFLQDYIEDKGSTKLCQTRRPFIGCGKYTKRKLAKLWRKYGLQSVSEINARLEKLYVYEAAKANTNKVWTRQQIEVIEFAREAHMGPAGIQPKEL